MSSAVVSTSAALGRPFVFEDETDPEVRLPAEPAQGRPPRPVRHGEISGDLATTDPKLARITSASRLEVRPAPEMTSSGIPALDSLTGGLPRGCVTEICGPASSGRTTVLLAALAAATCRGEYCAVIDASDALDPHSAAASGIDLDRLLWVRCGRDAHAEHPTLADFRREGVSPQASFNFKDNSFQKNGWNKKDPSGDSSHQSERRLEQVLRATDLLLESGGFGLIALDVSDLPLQSARRIPLTTWFRFRRAVEHKPTILLAIEEQPIAGSCSTLLLQLRAQNNSEEIMQRTQSESGCEASALLSPPTHTNLLDGLKVHAELARSRINRKPAQSIAFETKTAWAG